MANSPVPTPTSPSSSTRTEPFGSSEEMNKVKNTEGNKPSTGHPEWSTYLDPESPNTTLSGKSYLPLKNLKEKEDTGSPCPAPATPSRKRRKFTHLQVVQEHLSWSIEDDWRLVTMRHNKPEWNTICTAFPGRTAGDCASRYRSIQVSPEFNEEAMNKVALCYQR